MHQPNGRKGAIEIRQGFVNNSCLSEKHLYTAWSMSRDLFSSVVKRQYYWRSLHGLLFSSRVSVCVIKSSINGRTLRFTWLGNNDVNWGHPDRGQQSSSVCSYRAFFYLSKFYLVKSSHLRSVDIWRVCFCLLLDVFDVAFCRVWYFEYL